MTPSGTICICANTNLKYQSEDTIVFASESAKRSYFDAKVIKTFTDQMYTRSNTNGVNSTLNGKLYVAPGTSSIKVNCPISEIYNADYMFFVDNGYTGKTFYNFITDVSYVSDAVTQITFTEDVFMTWQNNVVIQNSFVERESTATDEAFSDAHDVPDILAGEYRQYERVDLGSGYTQSKYGCMVLNTLAFPYVDGSNGIKIDTAGISGVSGYTYFYYNGYGKNQNRLDSLVYVFFPLSALASNNSIKMAFSAYFNHVVDTHFFAKEEGKYDIIGLYSLPEVCLPYDVISYLSGTSDRIAYVVPRLDYTLNGHTPSVTCNFFLYQQTATEETLNAVAYPGAYGSYTPKNKKLLSAPYNYFVLTNNQGQEIKFKPQHFLKSGGQIDVSFKVKGSYSNFSNVDILPIGYDTGGQLLVNNTYRMSIDNYPEVVYQYDKAADFNQARLISNAIGAVGSLTGFAQGITNTVSSALPDKKGNSAKGIDIAGNIIGNVTSGIGIAEEIVGAIQDYNLSTKWDFPTVHGVDKSGIVPTAEDLMKFTLIDVALDVDSAKAIDNLFTRFGYAIKKIKSVSIDLNNRQNFHFVKTSGCNITGAVPMYAKNYLNDRFDKGIRMWAPSRYLTDFENNPIVYA